MRRLSYLLLLSVLALGCPRSELGDRLFEINYPAITFVIPAGQASFQTFVIAQPELPTQFLATLIDREVDEAEVDAVSGLRARISSLSGEDFREIERMELRVCGSDEVGCTQIDIMFSVSDLTGRRQTSVNLNPGLRNFRELYLSQEVVRMELVIFPSNVTSQTIECRLDWSIRAVGGL